MPPDSLRCLFNKYRANASNKANEYLFGKNFPQALYYSIVALDTDQSDWSVIRCASAMKAVGLEHESIDLILMFDNPERGSNFKYALFHHLVSAQREEEAANIDLDNCKVGKIEPLYIRTRIKALLENDDVSSAVRVFEQHIESFSSSPPWAHFATLYMLRNRVSDTKLLEYVDGFAAAHASLNEEQGQFVAETQVRLRGATTLSNTDEPAIRARVHDIQRFYKDHPLERSLAVARSIEASSSFIDVGQIAERIEEAIVQREPLSFIRIGDGEGRFLSSLNNYPTLKTEAVEIAKRVWFWNSNGVPGNEFFDRFRQSVENADILGFNPESRLKFEARNMLIGYAGVVLGNSFIDVLQRERHKAVCANSANIILENRGFFRRLVTIPEKVGVISPHAELGSVIRSWGAKHVESYIIPSEGNTVVKKKSITEPHYPNRYEALSRSLQESEAHAFLVAGGIFGKIYCDILRDNGKVSIDVGSLADRWVGIHTR